MQQFCTYPPKGHTSQAGDSLQEGPGTGFHTLNGGCEEGMPVGTAWLIAAALWPEKLHLPKFPLGYRAADGPGPKGLSLPLQAPNSA